MVKMYRLLIKFICIIWFIIVVVDACFNANHENVKLFFKKSSFFK
jgi:hypothetical protein